MILPSLASDSCNGWHSRCSISLTVSCRNNTKGVFGEEGGWVSHEFETTSVNRNFLHGIKTSACVLFKSLVSRGLNEEGSFIA